MKKFLSLALAVLMLAVMLPITALAAATNGSINGAIINQNAVSVELENVNFASSVEVQLYSDATLLTTATLNTDKLESHSYPYLTCCIATETPDEYWSLTPWTPWDNVVPNKAVLFVDGQKQDTETFTLDADEWANLPGTVIPSIVIVPDRTEDTPKTEDQKNPSTGANDVVAAAVALMAVSALGMAVLTRKK